MAKTFLCKIILALFVLVSWLLPVITVHSEEQPPVEKTETEPGMLVSLIDSSHDYLADKANGPAVWFDSFFGNPRFLDVEQPSTFIRLRIASHLVEGEGVTFPIRLGGRIRIPGASRKLRLILFGEGDDEFTTTNEEDSSTTIIEDGDAQTKSNAGLRYKLYNTLRSKLHLSVGGRLFSPFEYYYRVRFRRLVHIGSNNIVALKGSGYWKSNDGYGTTATLDYDRTLTETVTGRLSLSGIRAEVDHVHAWGVTWGVTTSLFKKFSDKTAASLDIGAFGVTRPETEITNYRIGCRMRKKFSRPWLFLEVTPEVTFPRNELTGERDAIGAILLMLEVQFTAR